MMLKEDVCFWTYRWPYPYIESTFLFPREFCNVVAVYETSAIILSLITLSIIFINATTQVAYGLGTQFSLGTYNYTGLEQNTRAFLNNLQQQRGPPIYTLSPEKARAVLSGLQASYPFQKLPADIENRTIPGGPNATEISITIVRPPNSSNETLPVIMYFHGGGWVLGGFDTHDRLVRELANKANVAVIFVNYTPSPEAKYPVALEQAYAATKWVAQNGQTINVNSSSLAVVEDSVGGNMALLLSHCLPKSMANHQLDSKCSSIQLLMLILTLRHI